MKTRTNCPLAANCERFINRSVVSSLGMSANPVTMEAFRESEVLRWILLDDYLAVLRVAWGADHQKDPNDTFDSLKASKSANPATMEDFRVSKVF